MSLDTLIKELQKVQESRGLTDKNIHVEVRNCAGDYDFLSVISLTLERYGPNKDKFVLQLDV